MTSDDRTDTTGVATVNLAIEGMHCGSCSALVEETLVEHPGVLEASVDLEAARAVVRYDGGVLGVADLCGLIDGVGYEAAVVEPT